MTPDQWARISDVLDEALDRSPEERSEFVAACSGDAAIGEEVKRLLVSNDRASGFMNSPAWLKGDVLIRVSNADAQREEESLAPSISVDLKPGDIFAGRYQIEAELGRGGFGVVYSAFDRSLLQRTVALKLFCPASSNPEIADLARRRFLEEARIAANLSHSNIATVYEAGESAGCVYMTQELAPGCNLGEVLREGGALPPGRSVAIARQICTGLTHAHARGVVHRDIKPGNIIVDAEDHVKVTDFGIAQPPREDSPLQRSDRRHSGLHGARAIARRTGGRPHGHLCRGLRSLRNARRATPLRRDHQRRTLASLQSEPSRVRGDLPRALDQIVTRAMKRSPDERYGDISQLQKELADYEEPRRLWPAAVAAALLRACSRLPLGLDDPPVPGNFEDPASYSWMRGPKFCYHACAR